MENQKPAHTPGPWAVESDTDIVSNSGDFVASCHEPESGVGTAREYANARLIAAAPRILAALRTAENALRYAAQESAGRVRSEIVGGWLYHADQCRAVIADAVGGAE